MRFVVAAAAAAQLVSAAIPLSSVKHASTANTVPNSYIVTLGTGSHLKRGFATPHEELYHDLARRGASWTVKNEYSSTCLTGAAVKLGSQADLVQLAQATGVESITPIYLHKPPKPFYSQVVTSTYKPSTNDVLSTHVMTGVDKLHADGVYGKGIKIGIIDTGIDYTHPALGGKFGPGNKVIGGYDFVGDAYTGLAGTPPPAPDNDPLDQCNGHGTHVAGIIGADPNNPYNISGVAYEASINAYRVFGCSGSVPDNILIDALVKAYKDDNDVITLSLGGADGWTEAVSGVVASCIADQGRIVTIAAGNDGQYGSWYASGPGTGLSVISVGSVDNTVNTVQNATVSTGRAVSYNALFPLAINGSLPIYSTTDDVTAVADACDPLPATTPNLSGYLVVIRRGTCAFTQKLDNAAAFGAKYFLIYDNKDQALSSIGVGNYTATLISQADGIYLVQEAKPKNATISFPNNPVTVSVPGGGLMSSFSTYGPSNDMYFKPAVSAPGGNILSTYPVKMGAYAIESGTSMATPFVAGSAALLLQVRGKNADTAKAARSIFENTAVPVQFAATNGSLLETASHQGAGLINVYDAIHNTGCMLPAELLVNDTTHSKNAFPVSIKNGGKKDVTYTFTHIPAGTAPTINGIENIAGPVPLVANAAEVKIIPSSLKVPAGWTLPIIVTVKAPTGLDAKTFPVFSGFIKATGSDGSTLHSTYLGVAAALKDMKILDNTDAYFGAKLPLVTDNAGNPINGSTTYTMNGTDTPLVVYRLVAGTPLLRLDLIDCKSNVTTNQRRSVPIVPTSESKVESREVHSTIGKRSIWDWLYPSKDNSGGGTFGGVKTIGTIFQEDYISRNSAAATADDNGYSSTPVTQFANGTAIPNGCFKVLLRALKITGDAKKEEDYEVWTSPEIVVKRA